MADNEIKIQVHIDIPKAEADLQKELNIISEKLKFQIGNIDINSEAITGEIENLKAKIDKSLGSIGTENITASSAALTKLTQQSKEVRKETELTGQAGKSLFDVIKGEIEKFSDLVSIYQIFMGESSKISKSEQELTNINNILNKYSEKSGTLKSVLIPAISASASLKNKGGGKTAPLLNMPFLNYNNELCA